MSVLLDTHIWIWWLTGQPELPAKERAALDRAVQEEAPFLCDMSLWEVQMLHAKGRLKLNIPFNQWIVRATLPDLVQPAHLTPDVVLKLDALPPAFPGDPADRVIVATSQALGLPLCTHDRRIRKAGLTKLWKA